MIQQIEFKEKIVVLNQHKLQPNIFRQLNYLLHETCKLFGVGVK